MYAPSKLKFNLVSYTCRGLPKDKKKLDLRPDIQQIWSLGGYEFGLEIESVLGKFEKTIYNDI